MPPAIIAAAIAAAATVGTTAYEANNSNIDQGNAAKQLTAQQQSQANQANLTKQEAVLSQQGQAQEQTGGSLTDSGTAALTDLLAGYPGYQAGGNGGSPATSTSTGTGIGTSGVADASTAAGQPSGSGAPPDIAAILATLRGQGGGGFGGSGGSTLSGGNWQTQPAQPQSFQQLANPVLG